MKVIYATLSKKGPRSNNEDRMKVIDHTDEDRWLGIVCDGMGGHACGEVASEVVTDAISEYWETHLDESNSYEKVKVACKKASIAFDKRATDMRHTEMGSTMVMASIQGDTVTIAHLGDSRCYLQRKGNELFYQTKDHLRYEFGWELVDKCFFSYRPEKADPEVRQFKLQSGDRILLCSDGLYKSIYPDILKERMMDDKTPEQILDVYDFLCEKSGDDNYTAILATIMEI